MSGRDDDFGREDGLEDLGGAAPAGPPTHRSAPRAEPPSPPPPPPQSEITEDRIPYAPEPALEPDAAFDGEGGHGVDPREAEEDAALGGRRRHERVNAPLDIIFQRKIYKAMDWSMTGFALEPGSFDLPVGQRFRFHARFHLRGAQMAAEFQAEVARRTPQRVGCRFVDPDPDQIQVLRMLLAAYRSGRAPAWEAMMALDDGGPLRGATHRAVTPAQKAAGGGDGGGLPPGDAEMGSAASGFLGWRPSPRLIYGILALVVLCVVGLLALTRLSPDVESAFAAVTLPGETLRAERAGEVTEVLAAPGDLVGERTLVLMLRPEGADPETQVPLMSGQAGMVREVKVGPGDRIIEGDPLFTLGGVEGAGTGPLVEALFPRADLDHLSPGTVLDVRLAGTNALVTGRVLALGDAGASVEALPKVLEERGGLSRVYVDIGGTSQDIYDGQPARARLRRSLLALLGL